ncbi:hypothetical protein [Paracoccus nototheniae]|uniref:hypothetical protein n=1 Tax=Paracoccus nototheniae TaxID=2489002 RepID=UPI0013F4AE3F|nr:hypothetical protein [Paracoccus nototheniae]
MNQTKKLGADRSWRLKQESWERDQAIERMIEAKVVHALRILKIDSSEICAVSTRSAT